MKKHLYIIAVVVLLIVFGVSAFQVGSYFLEGKEQEKKFDELSAAVEAAQQQAATETTEATQATEEEPVETTDIELKNLPSADRKQLEAGIFIQNDEELAQILEDLGS